MARPEIGFEEIRRLGIVSMFSDDTLMSKLVLKGGNAISLVHGIGSRSSVDLDFSMEADFSDLEDARKRIRRALEERFDSAGYTVFDMQLVPQPQKPPPDQPTWGGYRIEFKIIAKQRYSELAEQQDRRRQATVTGPNQQRKFKIEISKHEHCDGKLETELDGYTIYVYSPVMLVLEKLRAICQQMPEYELVRNPRGRARDFYDIHTVVKETNLELGTPEHLRRAEKIFASKQVPVALIPRIPEFREFHGQDWPAVQNAVSGELESFDFYFDSVVTLSNELKSLWKE